MKLFAFVISMTLSSIAHADKTSVSNLDLKQYACKVSYDIFADGEYVNQVFVGGKFSEHAEGNLTFVWEESSREALKRLLSLNTLSRDDQGRLGVNSFAYNGRTSLWVILPESNCRQVSK